jgi:uncharacterized protein
LPVVRRDEKKVRVSREESEVKKECKEIDNIEREYSNRLSEYADKISKITKTEVKEKQPPIQPTTLSGKIQFYFMRLFA